MTLKVWLAEKLCPDMARSARRYEYLWHQVDDVHKWCDGEARDVAAYLLDADYNHWRPLGSEAKTRTTYGGISVFRNWLYCRRNQPADLPRS